MISPFTSFALSPRIGVKYPDGLLFNTRNQTCILPFASLGKHHLEKRIKCFGTVRFAIGLQSIIKNKTRTSTYAEIRVITGFLNGAPERTRTSDTQFRKLLLYPAELQAHVLVHCIPYLYYMQNSLHKQETVSLARCNRQDLLSIFC